MVGESYFTDAAEAQARLDEVDYLVDEGLATALFLALTLGQPLLLEGEPGVGKTTAAKALARTFDAPLVRLQCYEGLAVGEALYEWNYQRQLLAIRLAESRHERLAEASRNSVLSDIRRSLRERTSLAFSINARARAHEDWREHAGILAAVIDGDEAAD